MREVSCRNDPSGAYTVLHAVPSINTRALYAEVTNSIAKKGVQRVEDPLAGSRGSAPCGVQRQSLWRLPLINVEGKETDENPDGQ